MEHDLGLFPFWVRFALMTALAVVSTFGIVNLHVGDCRRPQLRNLQSRLVPFVFFAMILLLGLGQMPLRQFDAGLLLLAGFAATSRQWLDGWKIALLEAQERHVANLQK
jgi:hypothetical protein